jgi:uncharacterized protein YheU (UPF0270 family)
MSTLRGSRAFSNVQVDALRFQNASFEGETGFLALATDGTVGVTTDLNVTSLNVSGAANIQTLNASNINSTSVQTFLANVTGNLQASNATINNLNITGTFNPGPSVVLPVVTENFYVKDFIVIGTTGTTYVRQAMLDVFNDIHAGGDIDTSGNLQVDLSLNVTGNASIVGDVTIPSGRINVNQINSNISTLTLSAIGNNPFNVNIDNGGTLHVNGGDIDVCGNIIADGSITAGSGAVVINSAGISTTDISCNNITVLNTANITQIAGSTLTVNLSPTNSAMVLNSGSTYALELFPHLTSAGTQNGLVQNNDAAIVWDGPGGAVLGPVTGLARGIRIDNSGNVGINVVSTTYALDVSGSEYISGGLTVHGSLSVGEGTTVDSAIYLRGNNVIPTIQNTGIGYAGAALTYNAIHNSGFGNLEVTIGQGTGSGSLNIFNVAGVSGNTPHNNIFTLDRTGNMYLRGDAGTTVTVFGPSSSDLKITSSNNVTVNVGTTTARNLNVTNTVAMSSTTAEPTNITLSPYNLTSDYNPATYNGDAALVWSSQSGALHITPHSNISSGMRLDASGNAYLWGGLTATGQITASAGITANGVTSTTLTVTGNATVGGTLAATGQITASAGITANGVITTGLTVTGNASVSGNVDSSVLITQIGRIKTLYVTPSEGGIPTIPATGNGAAITWNGITSSGNGNLEVTIGQGLGSGGLNIFNVGGTAGTTPQNNIFTLDRTGNMYLRGDAGTTVTVFGPSSSDLQITSSNNVTVNIGATAARNLNITNDAVTSATWAEKSNITLCPYDFGGGYNPASYSGDAALVWSSQSGALHITPHSGTSSGMRLDASGNAYLWGGLTVTDGIQNVTGDLEILAIDSANITIGGAAEENLSVINPGATGINASPAASSQILAVPYSAGGYNPTTQNGDAVIAWNSASGALNIAPQSGTTTGMRFDNAGNVTITVSPNDATNVTILNGAVNGVNDPQDTETTINVIPYVANGALSGYNPTTQDGDAVIAWNSASGALNITPHSGITTGMRFDGAGDITVTGGNLTLTGGFIKTPGIGSKGGTFTTSTSPGTTVTFAPSELPSTPCIFKIRCVSVGSPFTLFFEGMGSYVPNSYFDGDTMYGTDGQWEGSETTGFNNLLVIKPVFSGVNAYYNVTFYT